MIMKRKSVQIVLILSLVTGMSACNNMKEEPAAVVVDKEQIKKEIQARENEFAAAYNDEGKRNIGYYAEDAVSYYQNRAPLVGKATIIEYLTAGIDSNSNKISFKTNEVFVCNGGDQVLELGSFTVVDSVNNPVNTGNYMSLFEKRNGKYVCLRDMSASDIPLE
jgi:ketosteroid isomerase-like protein